MSLAFSGLGGESKPARPKPARGSPRSADGRIFSAAVEVFGVTGYEPEAGYVLPDGELLDFSGRRDGGSGGTRNYDHRQIAEAYDAAKAVPKGERGGYSTAMIDFIRRGAIRLNLTGMEGHLGIDFQEPPTSQQWSVLRTLLHDWKPEGVQIDLQDDSGSTTGSHELEGHEVTMDNLREVVRLLIFNARFPGAAADIGAKIRGDE